MAEIHVGCLLHLHKGGKRGRVVVRVFVVGGGGTSRPGTCRLPSAYGKGGGCECGGMEGPRGQRTLLVAFHTTPHCTCCAMSMVLFMVASVVSRMLNSARKSNKKAPEGGGGAFCHRAVEVSQRPATEEDVVHSPLVCIMARCRLEGRRGGVHAPALPPHTLLPPVPPTWPREPVLWQLVGEAMQSVLHELEDALGWGRRVEGGGGGVMEVTPCSPFAGGAQWGSKGVRGVDSRPGVEAMLPVLHELR